MILVPVLLLVAPAGTPLLGQPELTALLKEARQSAPDLAVVLARLERARVVAHAAGVERLPRLDAIASTGRSRDQDASGVTEVHNQHRAGLELSWEIDLWGRLGHARDAAEQDAEAAREDLRAAWLVLESEIVETFVHVRLLEAATPHHVARVAAGRRTVALHEARAEAGLDTPTMVHQARLALRQIETEELAHRRTLVTARHRLALLAGQTPAWSPRPGPALDLPELPAGMDSGLLEARPDLRAAQRRMEAARLRIGEARAARYPRFTLTGAYGMTSQELRDLVSERSTQWSFLPSLTVPLLDGGRSRLRVEASLAESREAQAVVQQAHHRALHEVAEALDQIAEDRLALAHWQEAVQSAEALYTARQAERGAGRIGGLAVVESDLERHGIALQALDARIRLAQSRVLVQRSLGQFWVPFDPGSL